MGEAPVTVAEVIQTLNTNADTSRRVAGTILEDVAQAIAKGDVLTEATGSMKYSIFTASALQSKEDKARLSYILPYFEQ